MTIRHTAVFSFIICLLCCGGSAVTSKYEIITGDAMEINEIPDANLETGENIYDSLQEMDTFENPDIPLVCDEKLKQDLCPCTGNDECASYFCLETFGGKKCAKLCPGEVKCPNFSTCTPVTIGGDSFFVCIFNFVHLCLPCYTSNECAPDGICLSYGNTGSFCAVECIDGTKCPEGYICENTGKGKLCRPENWECPCSEKAKKAGLSTTCFSENPNGKCEGKRICTGEGLSNCDAPDAKPEECNGKDENCNGEIDENLPDCCKCGNKTCESFFPCGEYGGEWIEGKANYCPVDCPTCGNGKCEPGEGPVLCPQDCCGYCGDKKCASYPNCPENKDACPEDCAPSACGNGICEKGENPVVCSTDCQKYVCGNGSCEPGEDLQGDTPCLTDCQASCGNCTCEGEESYETCPLDCGYCGDGYCSMCPSLGEMVEKNGISTAICVKDCCENDPNYCLIGKLCYEKGLPDPANPCRICNPDIDKYGWTPVPEGNQVTCEDSDGCTLNDFCSGGTCQPGMPVDCSAVDEPCRKGACISNMSGQSSETYECITVNIKFGTPCDIGASSFVPAICIEGVCIPDEFTVWGEMSASLAPVVSQTDLYEISGMFDMSDSDVSNAPLLLETDDYIINVW